MLFDGYGRSGAVSPDGKQLLFTREGTAWWRKGYRGSQASQIWLYASDSRKFTALVREATGARSPFWAPDGKGFYYVGGQSGSFNLWYRDLHGDKERQLTRFDDDSVVMPCIARDGSVIVIRHLLDLYRIRPHKDQSPKRLTITVEADLATQRTQRRRLDKATEIAFTADGLEMAFVAGGDLWVMDTELREPRQVTDTPEEERDLAFAPDGKSILFASDTRGQSDLWKAQRADAESYWWRNDQFVLTRLTNDPEVERDVRYSPTGKEVAFVRGRGDLWLIGSDGKNARRVIASCNRPDYDWSPDGKWLVYALSDDQFNRDVWIHSIDGSREPLNLSRHLGFSPRRENKHESDTVWSKTTAHFGLRFEADYQGPGLKVRDVIARSPADQAKSRIRAGEIVMAVDARPVDPGMDLTTVLNGSLDRDVRLRVKSADGDDREVTLRPIGYAAARSLLYEAFVKTNRTAVEKASNGKLGYLHIRAMNMTSFYRFEHDLYDAAAGKEGLVIDVRENGGGSTTDHLLTALTQPVHAVTVPRDGTPGYPQDRRVYATWNKPIVVLCNQNSFSNAEIFSHAVKTLRRGKLVGVPTAGAVISTGSTSIMDLGTLRVPFRGWFVLGTGEDMELNGAKPHFVLWPKPGEMPQGVDRQLAKGVRVLQREVKKWSKRRVPKPKMASQR